MVLWCCYYRYCGEAGWSKRAWHGSVVFQGKLWIMGGSPLNNDIWFLQPNITVVPKSSTPLTRSMYGVICNIRSCQCSDWCISMQRWLYSVCAVMMVADSCGLCCYRFVPYTYALEWTQVPMMGEVSVIL